MSVLAAKQAQLTAKLDEADALQKGFADDPATHTPEAQEKFNGIVEEVKSLQAEVKTARELEKAREETEPAPERKTRENGNYAPAQVSENWTTLGDQIIEQFKKGGSKIGVSQEFKAKGMLHSSGALAPETKTTFDTTGAGLDTSRNYVTPPGGLVLIEQQRLTIRDLIPVGQTVQNTVYYPKETLYTNAATTVAEEGEKPEATLDIESGSAAVKKIAVLIKVSDEMWDDFPMLRDYVNTRLRFMVEQEEEDQLLNGSGTGNDITGILNTSGIQTQAEGADTPADAIFRAMTKIKVPASNVGGYNPSGIVMHPLDGELIRLSKDDNNQYYFGGPSYAPYGNGPYSGAFRLWGLPVVETTAITQGTALVGDFRMGAQIFQRTGIDVRTFDQNEDDVNFNRKTIRVEERLALAVYRPSAFCTVTSID